MLRDTIRRLGNSCAAASKTPASPTRTRSAASAFLPAPMSIHRSEILDRHRGRQEGRRSEEHTSELQSRPHLVCRLLLEKKKSTQTSILYLPPKHLPMFSVSSY